MSHANPSAVFVYGTLKRGEINHPLLAPHALSIEAGSIEGRLFDLGEFPGLIEGPGRVHGELARIDPQRWNALLAVLDRLEGCVPGDDAASMYTRRAVEVTLRSGEREPALVYLYNPAHPALLPIDALLPLPDGLWPPAESPYHPDPNAPAGPALDLPRGSDELDAYRRFVRDFRG